MIIDGGSQYGAVQSRNPDSKLREKREGVLLAVLFYEIINTHFLIEVVIKSSLL